MSEYNASTIAMVRSKEVWKYPSGLVFPAALGAFIASTMPMVALMSFGVIDKSVTAVLAVGVIAALAGIFVPSMISKLLIREDHKQARAKVANALERLVDDESLPTRSQMDDLFREGKTLPVTINGVSGAKVYRFATHQSDSSKGATYHLGYSVHPLDDGVGNFRNMLDHAVESNADIKRARDAVASS